MGGHYTTAASQQAVPTRVLFEMLRPHFTVEIPDWIEILIDGVEAEREVVGSDTKARSTSGNLRCRLLVEQRFMNMGLRLPPPPPPANGKDGVQR